MLLFFILSATRSSILILFSYLLAIVANPRFEVSAYIPITIGQESVIPPNKIASTPVWQTHPPMPSPHPGFEVTNIGNTAVRASIYWKDSWPLQTDDVFCEAHTNCSTNSSVNVWYELAEPVHIEPFKLAVIRPSTEATFYFTRLVVVSNHLENNNGSQTVVNVQFADGDSGPVTSAKKKRDANSQMSVGDNLKTVFKFGVSKLPKNMTVSGMEALIELFWPENKTSVWHEVRDQVRNLIDQETSHTINTLLTARLMGFKRKLEQLAMEIREGQSDVSFHYMNLAQDFIGLEEESIIRDHHNVEKLNKDLLPVYSNIILMKAAFYSLGIKCFQSVGLTQQNVATIRSYFTVMTRSPIHGANQHISQIFRNQSIITSGYDQEMRMRNMIKEHAYVPIWNNMLDHPEQKLIIDEIFYSDCGGWYDDKYPSARPPASDDPLTSAGLSEGKYNDLHTLILYQSYNACTKNCCGDAIVGMKLIFKNGASSKFGKITPIYRVVELNGTYLIREIKGRYINGTEGLSSLRINLLKLDKNEWENSVETEYHIFGCPSNDTLEENHFAKENYYIASIYAYFDPEPRHYPYIYPLMHLGVSFLPLRNYSNNTHSGDEKDWKEWTC